MNEAQTFFSQPGVGFFTMLLIGALAGWIAERVTASDHGGLGDTIQYWRAKGSLGVKF